MKDFGIENEILRLAVSEIAGLPVGGELSFKVGDADKAKDKGKFFE